MNCHAAHGREFQINQNIQDLEEREVSHNRFKTFFEQSVLPMQIFDLDGFALAINEAWCKLFEVPGEAVKGYNIKQDQSTSFLGLGPYLEKAYGGEAVAVPPIFFDPRMIGRPGRARWLEVWFSPVRDQNGQVIELAVILKDVTEWFETKRILDQSVTQRKLAENRLSMAVKATKVGIWEWKIDSSELNWDETLEALCGFVPGSFSGKVEDFLNSIHPDDKEFFLKAIGDSQRLGKSFVLDHRIIRSDGELRWLQCSGTPIFDGAGKCDLLMGTYTDITDKKIVELDQKFLSNVTDSLSQSFDFLSNGQQMANLAIDYFCDGCMIDQLKPDGAIERIIVASKSGLFNEKLNQIHDNHPQRYTEDHPLFSTLISGKTVFLKETLAWPSIQEKFGEEYHRDLSDLNIQGTIIVRLKGKKSLIGTITFITLKGSQHVFTDRHQYLAQEIAFRASMSLENSLLYSNAQEAIKSRDEFLSIASHELKTPLTGLTLQNQMRKRQLDRGEGEKLLELTSLRKMIESDEKQLRRINRLIDDMLDITRIRADKLVIHKEQFEFSAFVRDVVERVAPQLEAAGCPFSMELSGPVLVEADLYRIEQVIVNILMNALKYGAGRPVKIILEKLPYKVRLQFCDQGPGIRPEDRERIFQRFERAVSSREVSGLGLGLYISRQIMDQHEGALYVASTPVQGSTFVLELPLRYA